MFKKVLLLALVAAGTFALTGCKSDDTLANLEDALAEVSVEAVVVDDITLPTTGANDVVISWASDNTDVITADGTVTRPSAEDGDATVVLTATLTLGEEELTQDFTVTVTALEPSNPMDTLTDGYLVFSFYAEGYGSYTSYFNFYEDDPVLGAVFYFGASNNSQNFAGTYTIEEMDYEWAAYPDRAAKVADETEDNSEKTTGTAPYTITFFDFEGTEMDQAGYDGDFLYHDMTDANLAPAGTADQYYAHDTLGATSEFVDTYAAEVGIPYVSLVDPTDAAATLDLNHNKTYADLIGEFIVEGTWAVADGADDSLEFTLTPTESYDTGALVVLDSEQTSATYTADGTTDVIDLEVPVEVIPEDTRVVLFEWDAGDSTDRTFTFFNDGTWEFDYSNGTLVEVGTFTFTGWTLTVIQDNGTEIVAVMDGTTHAFSVDYVAVASDQLTGTFTAESAVWAAGLGSTGEFEPVIPGPKVLFEWTSGNENRTLTFYENGWYKFEESSFGIVEYGTFDITYATVTLTQSNDDVLTAVRDGETNLQTLSYVTVAGDGAISEDFTAELATWSEVTDAQGSYEPVYDNEYVLFEWTSGNENRTFTFYVTGVYKFEETSFGIIEYGMFDITYGTITLTQSNDDVITGVRDGETNLQTISYVTVAGDGAISEDFTAELATWSAVTNAQGSYTARFTKDAPEE